ncbi:hypothetical protein MCAG_02686 [Micromonospora sp. ATCC 39149]|nr:hypothetical protein MCAG_02686 [Micromonospora sp. ATCC 39149]
MSARTLSVTRLINSRDTSASYTSARCAEISPVVNPLAYSDADRLVEPVQTTGVLRDDPRRERPGPVPRDLDPHRPDLGLHRLGPVAVTDVGPPAGCLIDARVVEVGIQFGVEGRFEHGAGDPGEEPTRPDQRDSVGLGPLDQLLRELHFHRRRLWK